MNKNTAHSFLKISLPQEIIVPADADLNALFAFMRTAQTAETIYSADDEERTDNNNYLGDSTLFAGGVVVPSVSPASVYFPTKKEAQDAKNKIVQAAMAERAQRDKERASAVVVAPLAPTGQEKAGAL